MPSLFSSVASRDRGTEHALMAALHIENIDFELITFTATSTTAVDNSAICTNKLLFGGGEILSLLVLALLTRR